jgi:hypothetical protein
MGSQFIVGKAELRAEFRFNKEGVAILPKQNKEVLLVFPLHPCLYGNFIGIHRFQDNPIAKVCIYIN